jgi:hypothetical protein
MPFVRPAHFLDGRDFLCRTPWYRQGRQKTFGADVRLLVQEGLLVQGLCKALIT